MTSAMAHHRRSESQSPVLVDYDDVVPLYSAILSYFPRKQLDSLPVPPFSSSSSIISSLLSSAGVDAKLYPPRTYLELEGLIAAIEQSSFDTLRRNALFYYLLLDYHLIPATPSSSSTISSLSSLAPRSPLINHFARNHLLPPFWTNSVEKGFWRFDKGFHNEAIPWLNAINSAPYGNHIIRTLSPLNGQGDILNKSKCLIKYFRIAMPTLPTTEADLDVVEAVLVSKTMVEGLQGALDLIRERPGIEQGRLFTTLWQWIFQLPRDNQPTSIRSSLLQSVVALPLFDNEVQTLIAFSLGKTTPLILSTPSLTLTKARQLGLDTLLVRLINSGRVLDALKINTLAEESQQAGIDVEEDEGGEEEAQRRKKRREMLRLAREMLPEVVRDQLANISITEQAGSSPHVSGDEEMQEDLLARDATKSLSPPTTAAATPNTSFTASNPLIRGYIQNRLPKSISSSRMSIGASPPPQRSTPTQQRAHIPLVSQSPLTLIAGHADSSFSRASPSGTRFTSLAPERDRNGDTEQEGPYARLAAQLAARQGDLSVTGGGGVGEMDESLLLSSLLPQKRDLASRKAEGDEGEPQGREKVGDGVSERSRGGFEVPKRRYTKKDQVTSLEGGATRNLHVSSTKGATPSKARNRTNAGESSRRTTSSLRKSLTMDHLSADVDQPQEEEVSPIKTRKSHTIRSAGNKKGGSTSSTTTAASVPAVVTRRSTRAQSEVIPGSFPGTGDVHEGEGDLHEHDEEGDEHGPGADHPTDSSQHPEMIQLPTTTTSGSASTSSRSRSKRSIHNAAVPAAAAAGGGVGVGRASSPSKTTGSMTPTPRKTRGKTPLPTESTPVRRSTRRQATTTTNTTRTNKGVSGISGKRASSRASSIVSSSLDGDAEELRDQHEVEVEDEDDGGDVEEEENEDEIGKFEHGRGYTRRNGRPATGKVQGKGKGGGGGRGSGRGRVTRSMSVVSTSTGIGGEEGFNDEGSQQDDEENHHHHPLRAGNEGGEKEGEEEDRDGDIQNGHELGVRRRSRRR